MVRHGWWRQGWALDSLELQMHGSGEAEVLLAALSGLHDAKAQSRVHGFPFYAPLWRSNVA